MATLGQMAVFFVLVVVACVWTATFSAIGALVAKLREVHVGLGGLYGAVLGPVGVAAVGFMPKRFLVSHVTRESRLTRLLNRQTVTTDDDDWLN